MRAIQHFEVSIKAFLVRDGRLLLVRERAGRQFWELPGGRIDVGEERVPAVEVLRRELREELGPDVLADVGAPLSTWVRPILPPRKADWVFFVGHLCTYRGGEIALSDEHIDHAWVTEGEWQKLTLAPGYDVALARFFELQKHGGGGK